MIKEHLFCNQRIVKSVWGRRLPLYIESLSMMKIIIRFISVILIIFALAIAGQIGRDLAKKRTPSKEDIKIKSIADQYANASKKMTAALTEFSKADQEIKSSVEQLKNLKELLIVSKKAFEHYEDIRLKGIDYLSKHSDAFEREFYDNMYFFFGSEPISEYNKTFIKFSSKYLEFIDYLILNFDKILSATKPEINHYNDKLGNCEILRQKYNEAYLKKLEEIKKKYGEETVNTITKKLQN